MLRLAPALVGLAAAYDSSCWTETQGMQNWGVNAGGCYGCLATGADLVAHCAALCVADSKCESFEVANEFVEREEPIVTCCLEHANQKDEAKPNLWLGKDDVDADACKDNVKGRTLYELNGACARADAAGAVDPTVTGACGKELDMFTNTEEEQGPRDKWIEDGCPPPMDPGLLTYLMCWTALLAFTMCFILVACGLLCMIDMDADRRNKLACYAFFYVAIGSTLFHAVIWPVTYWHESVGLIGMWGDILGAFFGLFCYCPCLQPCMKSILAGPPKLPEVAPAPIITVPPGLAVAGEQGQVKYAAEPEQGPVQGYYSPHN